MNTKAATEEVRQALDLLRRASADWRNGEARLSGPIHWSAAIPAAWQALSRALRALEAAEGGSAATATSATVATAALCRHCRGMGFQGGEPCEFCSATGREAHLEDALRGSLWWNSISRAERLHWLEIAGSAVPADAWRAFQAVEPRP